MCVVCVCGRLGRGGQLSGCAARAPAVQVEHVHHEERRRLVHNVPVFLRDTPAPAPEPLQEQAVLHPLGRWLPPPGPGSEGVAGGGGVAGFANLDREKKPSFRGVGWQNEKKPHPVSFRGAYRVPQAHRNACAHHAGFLSAHERETASQNPALKFSNFSAENSCSVPLRPDGSHS